MNTIDILLNDVVTTFSGQQHYNCFDGVAHRDCST
jgi:hypothetical protein